MTRAWMMVLAVAISAVAFGDEVILNNGDRLTGEVKSVDGGKMKVATAMAGTVEVNLSDVKTFSTDKPIELVLEDGTVLKQPIVQGAPGQISTGGKGPVLGNAIPIASIKKVNPPAVKWTGALTAGAILARGNTHTDSANAAFEAVRRAEIDRITLNASYNYAREKTEGSSPRVTSENWSAAGKYDYFIGDKWYVYGNAKVERDHIANLDIRFTPGVGAGYQWIESARTNFNTEGGLTWVYERFTDPESTRDYVAARLAYHYDRKLNDNVTFIHNLEILPSLEDFGQYILNVDAGIRARLTETFFGELKVVAQQNTQPAEGKSDWDTRYIANVGWTF